MNGGPFVLLVGLFLLSLAASPAEAQEDLAVPGPVEHVYAVRDTVELRAYVFSPSDRGDDTSGIVLFHGGRWHIGDARWAFSAARHFAEKGMVAVSAQYRLSDQGAVTPLEAMDDARDVILWMRANADSLGIDTGRVAAYGWSAGAHLAACAAIFEEADSDSILSSSPDALVLKSPAVSLVGDRWFQRLLGEGADASDASPDEHVRPGLPPVLILQGDVDTVKPLA
jgi:acetyl esterase/lipase